MTRPAFSAPMKEEEFTELDELLAQIDEKSMAMDASQADGFLTALCLLPKEVSPSEWMPMIFCARISTITISYSWTRRRPTRRGWSFRRNCAR